MMVLVGFIDLLVEYVKLLGGRSGNLATRVLAWVVLLVVVCAGVALVAFLVSRIPALIDVLNE